MSLKINANLVIIGNGTSFEKGSIVIDNEKIIYAGNHSEAPSADEEISTPVIMPGMWDTHSHFVGLYKASIEGTIFTKSTLAVLRSTWDTKEALRAGFTSVREVGGLGIPLNQAIQEGVILGPRIYAAGEILSTTGGHGDIHNIPLEFVSLMEGQGLSILCDGVAECLKAVRKQLREGAELIKYCASGGVMSKIDNPMHQQFSHEEQKAIVEEAKRSEVAIAAHCHGSAGIRSALEAGVTTIDHGTYLTEELADLMIEKGAILIPTRYAIEKLLQNVDKEDLPDYVVEKITAMGDQHMDALKIAIRKGVKIAVGTDIFVSGPGNIFTWGENALELKYLVDAGMSEMDAIVAATGNAPATLGPRAPKSGMLKVGYDADILLLEKNPLENIENLLDKSAMTVIKQGKIIKF